MLRIVISIFTGSVKLSPQYISVGIKSTESATSALLLGLVKKSLKDTYSPQTGPRN
jgi:hypothetical protein